MRQAIILWVIGVGISAPCLSQGLDPFLMTTPGNGVGQYGYVEKDVSSFTVINSNDYNNIYDSRTRYYVDGVSVVYNQVSPETPGCFPKNSLLTCPDYNPADFGTAWQAGNIMYVSSQLQYHTSTCSYVAGSWSHGVTDMGFNQRSFRIIDVEEVAADISPTLNNDGSNNIVLSFTIDPGGVSGLSLIRLWVYNNGAAPTSQETDDLPNEMRLYYEPVTGGTDVFDGTEPYDALWGDWGGDPTTNEVWGNSNIAGGSGISIPSGGLKCYLVFDALPVGYTPGRNTAIRFVNDGMSLLPARDVSLGSFTTVRLGESADYPSVLSITLTRFEAFAVGAGQVRLEWETESEINNSHFELEHSTDGLQWNEIGQVAGQGTTTATTNYILVDEQVPAGVHYYRLKQVDFDGSYTYSPIEVVNLQGNGAWYIWPNPASTYIQLPDIAGWASLFSMDGREMASTMLPLPAWNISHIPNGSYLLRISNGSAVVSQMIVLAR